MIYFKGDSFIVGPEEVIFRLDKNHYFENLYRDYCIAKNWIIKKCLKNGDKQLADKFEKCTLGEETILLNDYEKLIELLHSPQGVELMLICANHKELNKIVTHNDFCDLQGIYGDSNLRKKHIYVDAGVIYDPPEEHAIYVGQTYCKPICDKPILYQALCLYGASFIPKNKNKYALFDIKRGKYKGELVPHNRGVLSRKEPTIFKKNKGQWYNTDPMFRD